MIQVQKHRNPIKQSVNHCILTGALTGRASWSASLAIILRFHGDSHTLPRLLLPVSLFCFLPSWLLQQTGPVTGAGLPPPWTGVRRTTASPSTSQNSVSKRGKANPHKAIAFTWITAINITDFHWPRPACSETNGSTPPIINFLNVNDRLVAACMWCSSTAWN